MMEIHLHPVMDCQTLMKTKGANEVVVCLTGLVGEATGLVGAEG